MRVRDDVTNGAIFIGVETSSGPHWAGTGFLVEVPFQNGLDCSFRYLVTASHVAELTEGRNWFLRINNKGDSSAVVKLSGEFSEKVRWFRHPSRITDVAVIPVTSAFEQFDIRYVPIGRFLDEKTAKDHGIGIGDETVIIGLFTKHMGVTKNRPLIRLGNLAMFPDELISGVKYGFDREKGFPRVGDIQAYLVEVRSTGGLSGSPVFVKKTVVGRVGSEMIHGEGDAYLLGLAQGHWEIDPKDKNNVMLGPTGKEESINLGIALVMPAYIIREVLEQDGLRMAREKYEMNLLEQQGTTTPDNDLPEPPLSQADFENA